MVANDKLLRHKGEGEDGEERLGPKLYDLPAALTVRGGDAALTVSSDVGKLQNGVTRTVWDRWVDSRLGAGKNKWGRWGHQKDGEGEGSWSWRHVEENEGGGGSDQRACDEEWGP
jgi:hypothetical protein